jgi:hypothetical protein
LKQLYCRKNPETTALQAVRSIKAAAGEGFRSIIDNHSQKGWEDSNNTNFADAAAEGAASAAVRAVHIAAVTAAAAVDTWAGESFGGSFRGCSSMPGNSLPRVSSQDRLRDLLDFGHCKGLVSGKQKCEQLQACNQPPVSP